MSGITTSPAQPTLATIAVDGKQRDVVIQGTKQGLIFVLDRDTGIPLLRVEERPAPQGGVDGEALSPTQPFPADLPPLGPRPHHARSGLGAHAMGSRRVRQGDRLGARRGPLHPAEPARHADHAVHRRRRELGRPRRRWRQGHGLCQQLEPRAPGHPLSGRRLRRNEASASPTRRSRRSAARPMA